MTPCHIQKHHTCQLPVCVSPRNESLRQCLQDGLTDLGHDTVNHTITYQIAHLTQFSYFGRRRPTALEPGAEPVLAAAYVYLPVVARRDLTTIGTTEEAFQEKE